VVGRQKADIADTLHLRDVAMATTLAFYKLIYMGCTLAPPMVNIIPTTEPSTCGGDAA